MEVRERARSAIAGCAIFAVIAVRCWRAYVNTHERLYLLGPRRVADPSFLSVDFTWSRLSPTSFLYDHLLAPLWSYFGEFAIANIGRVLFWALLAWSLVALSRSLGIPRLALVAGFTLWLHWGQTLAICGSPIEGFQVKSLAYPLLFFSLAFVLRGQVARAGLSAGLATAIHIVVGGWGCLAIFLSMLADRERFPLRRLALFLLAAAPLVLPLVAAVGFFHEGGVSHEERARMDEIYVTLAAPYCCDPSMFMDTRTWARAAIVFLLAPLLVYAWKSDGARIAALFTTILVLLFLLGLAALHFRAYGLLTLFPGQLAKSLPALFLFVFFLASLGAGLSDRPARRALVVVALAGVAWLVYDRRVGSALVESPRRFLDELETPVWGAPPENEELYRFIREATPRESVFITPYLSDFWCYAERAQVASLRQSPLDRRLVEWKERLEAQKGFEPFRTRGEDTLAELDRGENRLAVGQLLEIRELYGATHYLTSGVRQDLPLPPLVSSQGYSVYDLSKLSSPESP